MYSFLKGKDASFVFIACSNRRLRLSQFPLKKAVKNRVQYHGENCNRGQFIALWNATF